jgi:GGDEF domain-containing protein
MTFTPDDGRAYFQRRLRDEIARCSRYHDVFGLILLVARPTAGHLPTARSTAVAARLLERRMRTSDVVDVVAVDEIAILLLGTPVSGLRDAEQRVRAALSAGGGSWELRRYAFPAQAAEIEALELLAAA